MSTPLPRMPAKDQEAMAAPSGRTCRALGCPKLPRRNGMCIRHRARWNSALIRGLAVDSLLFSWIYGAGFRYRDIGDQIGVTGCQVGMYAKGFCRPNKERFVWLARAVGKSVDDLERHYAKQKAILDARREAFRLSPPFPMRES